MMEDRYNMLRRANEVIEISSSEDDEPDQMTGRIGRCNAVADLSRWLNRRETEVVTGNVRFDAIATPSRAFRTRRVIHSPTSDEENHPPNRPGHAEPEVIEISDSSDLESSPPLHSVRARRPMERETAGSPYRTMRRLAIEDPEEDELEEGDDAILTLNEPKSARRPIKRVRAEASSGENSPFVGGRKNIVSQPEELGTPRRPTSSNDTLIETGPIPGPLAKLKAPRTAPSTPRTPKKTVPPKTPRTSKKAQALAAQAQRAEYAQALFDELNASVFEGELPATTQLIWSNRLLTTAGRARWHRSRVGVHTAEIELATKILDSNERIRNTLSHEMCHLACWIINKDPKEGHGNAFKAWAAKVMRRRPEIEITTRHDYEISYPYEWECGSCSKIYGRFSKSIRPDDVLCGACKTGKLVPLFTVRMRTTPRIASVKIGSKLAAGKARDSPRAIPPPAPEDVDSDLEVLTMTVNRLQLGEA